MIGFTCAYAVLNGLDLDGISVDEFSSWLCLCCLLELAWRSDPGKWFTTLFGL